MRALRVLLPVLLVPLLFSMPAWAGKRPFTWGWSTDILPEGDVELEQWLWAKGRAPDRPQTRSRGYVWWSPVFGLTEHLELFVPFELRGDRDGMDLHYFGADLRYRVKPRSDQGGFQLLFRGAYQHSFVADAHSRFDGNAIFSWGTARELFVNLDLGVQLEAPFMRGDEGPWVPRLTYDLGVALPLQADGEWQGGLELFGEIPANDFGKMHHFVGPTVSVTRGRMWATLGVLFGLTPLFPDTPVWMPRFMWAIVL